MQTLKPRPNPAVGYVTELSEMRGPRVRAASRITDDKRFDAALHRVPRSVASRSTSVELALVVDAIDNASHSRT